MCPEDESSTFVVRRAIEADDEAVGRVHTSAIRELSASHYTPEEIGVWSRPREPGHYVNAILSEEFYVAEKGNSIVAFGTLNSKSGEIEAVYVSPPMARRGVGSQILRVLEERARQLGLDCVHVDSALNAVSFYEKAGYERIGKSQHRLQSGGEIACVLMRKVMSRK